MIHHRARKRILPAHVIKQVSIWIRYVTIINIIKEYVHLTTNYSRFDNFSRIVRSYRTKS